VVEANAALAGDEGLVNRDPMGGGWFFRLAGVDEAAVAALMDESAYTAFLENNA
jgi:glycine cleavage system H protein